MTSRSIALRRIASTLLVAAIAVVSCGIFNFSQREYGFETVTGTELATQQARFRDVAACLQRFALSRGWTDARYDTLPPPTYVKFHGSGGYARGDTIFYSMDAATGQQVGIARHEDVHIVQQYDTRLQLGGADNHWPPPFDYCRIPLVLIG